MKVLEGSRWLKWCLAKTRKKICREASDVDILYSASWEKLDKDHLCGSGGDDGRGPWMAEGSRKGKELLLLLLIKVSESKPPLSWPHMHLSEQNGQALGDLSSYVTLTAPTQKLLLKTLREKDTTEKSQVGGLVERTMHCSSWADEKTQQDHRKWQLRWQLGHRQGAPLRHILRYMTIDFSQEWSQDKQPLADKEHNPEVQRTWGHLPGILTLSSQAWSQSYFPPKYPVTSLGREKSKGGNY